MRESKEVPALIQFVIYFTQAFIFKQNQLPTWKSVCKSEERNVIVSKMKHSAFKTSIGLYWIKKWRFQGYLEMEDNLLTAQSTDSMAAPNMFWRKQIYHWGLYKGRAVRRRSSQPNKWDA